MDTTTELTDRIAALEERVRILEEYHAAEDGLDLTDELKAYGFQ